MEGITGKETIMSKFKLGSIFVRGAVALLAVAVSVTGNVPEVVADPVDSIDRPVHLAEELVSVSPVVGANRSAIPKSAERQLRAAWPVGDLATPELVVSAGYVTWDSSGLVGVRLLDDNTHSSSLIRTRVLSHLESESLVGLGVVLVVEVPVGVETVVVVDYSSFGDVVGGGFGSRLELVELPGCALISPEDPDCLVQTRLDSVNDESAETVSVIVGRDDGFGADVGDTSAAGRDDGSVDDAGDGSDFVGDRSAAVELVVLAAVGGSSSDRGGDFEESGFQALGQWEVGANTGSFQYSVPLVVPSVPGGTDPGLVLSYDSGLSDGRVVKSNQSSWVGEGWSLGDWFIQRRFRSCSEDTASGGNDPSGSGDLCWFSGSKIVNDAPWDNALLVMDGHSGELVRVGNTNEWRLWRDDGT